MMPFADIRISQGSVATCLKRGGIFKHKFVANLLQSLIVKKFENRIIIGEVMAKSLVSCFFLTHGVLLLLHLQQQLGRLQLSIGSRYEAPAFCRSISAARLSSAANPQHMLLLLIHETDGHPTIT